MQKKGDSEKPPQNGFVRNLEVNPRTNGKPAT